jgi:protocatechuate 3,4-dioxygenase beta subunit
MSDLPVDPEVPKGTANEAYVRAVHDRGLSFDLRTMSRRSLLGLAGGVGAWALAACTSSGTAAPASSAASSSSSSAAASSSAASSSAAACAPEINSETAGPYPADGSNGTEIRTTDGIVRTDIRSSFGSASGTAEGVPLTITLTLQDLSCAPLSGAAVYLWHCDRSGNYSLYSQAVADQNYLRGIGQTDSSGRVTFTSIFPACYSGRWPHIHFEVYQSVDEATSGSGTIIKTSQLALPQDVCTTVYATDGYSASVSNLGQVTLATDNVFSDDSAAHQLGTVTGSVSAGYTVALTVPVDPSAVETGGAAPGGGSGDPGGAPGGGSGGPGGGGPGGPPSG